MKALTTTTTGNFSNLEGNLTHAGDYAGKYQAEAIKILESVSSTEMMGTWGEGNEDAWADIMLNERNGKLFAVWANDSLTAFSGDLEYIELDEQDCPRAFKDAAEKMVSE